VKIPKPTNRSLKTKVKAEAVRIIAAKYEAHYQPLMNLQILPAYMAAAEPAVRSRTWQHVMDEMAKGSQGVAVREIFASGKDYAIRLSWPVSTSRTYTLRIPFERPRPDPHPFLKTFTLGATRKLST
jgi:hypothetical protein